MIPVNFWCLIFLLLVSRAVASEFPKPISSQPKSNENSKDENHVPPRDIPHSRAKRLIWVTDDGRLA